MIIVGQANGWYEREPENDLLEDIKRKVLISPILLMLNVGFLGVAVMILVINEWVFLGNLAAMVIVLLMIVCSTSNLIVGFVTMHFWFLALIIWSIAEVNTHLDKYSGIGMVEKNYFNTIAGIIMGVGFLPGITLIFYAIYWLLSSCNQHSQFKSKRKGGNHGKKCRNNYSSPHKPEKNKVLGIHDLRKSKAKSTNVGRRFNY